MDDIPNKSCLSVTIRENILCQDDSIYCEIPEVASLIIRNVTITKSKIPFEVALIPRPSAGPYTISVVLNLGWCQKDASDGTWIKPGDYHNTVAHEFEVRELEDEIEKDVSLEKLKPLPTTGMFIYQNENTAKALLGLLLT